MLRRRESVLTSTGLCLHVCMHVHSSTVSLHTLMFCFSMLLSLIGNIRMFAFRCKEDTDLFAHVCVHYVCVYTHVWICLYSCLCCIYASHVCAHVYACVCSCVCVYLCWCVCVCVYSLFMWVCLYKSGSCHFTAVHAMGNLSQVISSLRENPREYLP